MEKKKHGILYQDLQEIILIKIWIWEIEHQQYGSDKKATFSLLRILKQLIQMLIKIFNILILKDFGPIFILVIVHSIIKQLALFYMKMMIKLRKLNQMLRIKYQNSLDSSQEERIEVIILELMANLVNLSLKQEKAHSYILLNNYRNMQQIVILNLYILAMKNLK